ncbi:MAG: hypothetical protein H6765_04355 [Candidatus Peribacteria bacterium]|nr:MAG: hypothetical protein H6765_04355 [Candidatus Peribacteria bacterium]
MRDFLLETFDKTAERGLLNRLDNDTQGWLYFASSPEVAVQYDIFQQDGLIEKQYVAQVK